MKPRSRKPRSVLLARKAEEQERIREIHSALGGSAEAFDRSSDRPPEEQASLDSRIDAYVKLQTAGRPSAPVAEPPESVDEPPVYEPPAYEPPVYEPPPVLEERPEPAYEPPPVLDELPEPAYELPPVLEVPPVAEAPPRVEAPPAPLAEPPVQLVATPASRPPAPRRVREPRVKAPRGPSVLSRARTAAAPRVRRGAWGLTRGVRGTARALVRLVLGAAGALPVVARLLLRSLGRLSASLAVALEHARSSIRRVASARRAARARPRRPARSREERHDQDRLSPSVLQRVHGYTPSATVDAPAVIAPDPEPVPEKVEPVAPPHPAPPPPAEQPREARVVRRLAVSPRLLLLAAALAGAAAAAVLVVDRGDGGSVSVSARDHAAAVRAMANVSTSRASFSNPGAYASAMTLLALANGRTHVSSQPSCDRKSTWRRWSCDARGLPSDGPYAGRWVTYRCTPSYAPQPGGAPAALVVNCRPQVA